MFDRTLKRERQIEALDEVLESDTCEIKIEKSKSKKIVIANQMYTNEWMFNTIICYYSLQIRSCS